MAKSGVGSYNVAPGADPLGIGVPYYGDSSFDPVEFVRRSWAESKANRMMKDQDKRAGYDKWMEDLPKVDAFEQAASEAINQEIGQLSEKVYSDYQSGDFDPTGRSSKGKTKAIEYNSTVRDIENKISIYKTLGEKWKANYTQLIRPENQEFMDKELTQQNVDNFLNEPDVKKKADVLAKGPLVVFKPKPVEVLDEMAKAWRLYPIEPGEDITSKSFDPDTQKYMVKSTKKLDPKKVAVTMEQRWNVLSDKVKNEWKRRYDQAPTEEKTVKLDDGTSMPIDVKDWWKAQNSPEYAEQINVSFVSKDDGSSGFNINWNFLPGRSQVTGKLDLSNHKEVRAYGVKTSVDPNAKPVQMKYNSAATLKLQSVFGSGLVMGNTLSTVDADTGEKEPASKSAYNIPIDVQVLPIALETITYTTPGPIPQTVTYEPGDKIPNNIQAEMDKANAEAIKAGEEPPYLYGYDAFLYSKTDYKQQAQMFQIGEMSMPMGTSSESKTTLRRWAEAKNDLVAGARNKKFDINPLLKSVDEILDELNTNYEKIIGNAKKANTYEETGL